MKSSIPPSIIPIIKQEVIHTGRSAQETIGAAGKGFQPDRAIEQLSSMPTPLIPKSIKATLLDILNPKTGEYVSPGIIFSKSSGVDGKVIAGEARDMAEKMNAPFISVSGSDFVSEYIGQGEKSISKLFSDARRAAAQADTQTAVVFVDNIDKLAGKISLTNQFMMEIDKKNPGARVVVVATAESTNALDPYLTRPGRLETN